MKATTVVCLTFFLAGAAVFLLQLWGSIWGAEIFGKILITYGVLFVASFVIIFLIKEIRDSNKISKGKGLD